MLINIVKFENQPIRELSPEEDLFALVQKFGDPEILLKVTKVTKFPEYDPKTHKAVFQSFSLEEGEWRAKYSLEALGQEELQNVYLAGLDWVSFIKGIVNPNPGSFFEQLTAWAILNPVVADSKINFSDSLNSGNHDFLVLSLSSLKSRLRDLHKGWTELPEEEQTSSPDWQLTEAQLLELDTHLETLKASWRWADL